MTASRTPLCTPTASLFNPSACPVRHCQPPLHPLCGRFTPSEASLHLLIPPLKPLCNSRPLCCSPCLTPLGAICSAFISPLHIFLCSCAVVLNPLCAFFTPPLPPPLHPPGPSLVLWGSALDMLHCYACAVGQKASSGGSRAAWGSPGLQEGDLRAEGHCRTQGGGSSAAQLEQTGRCPRGHSADPGLCAGRWASAAACIADHHRWANNKEE